MPLYAPTTLNNIHITFTCGLHLEHEKLFYIVFAALQALAQNITSYSAFFYFSFSFITTPGAPKISGATKCTFYITENADRGNLATCTVGYFTYMYTFSTWEILGSYSDVKKILESGNSYETSGTMYQSTRRHTVEHFILNYTTCFFYLDVPFVQKYNYQ